MPAETAKPKSKRTNRAKEVVFGDNLRKTYQSAIKVLTRVQKLSRSRGLSDMKAVETFNGFLKGYTNALSDCQVSAPITEAPKVEMSLETFIAKNK